MAISTKESVSALQSHISNKGAQILQQWMEGQRADLLAVAAQVDADRGTGTAAVDAITNIEE